MGEAKQRRLRIAGSGAMCIFCGGVEPATSEEHCPPRSLFEDRQWPQGFSFPACDHCNNGTSEEDSMVAFLAQLQPDQPGRADVAAGMLRRIERRFPDIRKEMLDMSISDLRHVARHLGIKPGPGQTYRDIPVARIPPPMVAAVRVFMGKLTRAVYFIHTNTIFPADGEAIGHWFTNAEAIRTGETAILKALRDIVAEHAPLTRSGKDLRDQFMYGYSVDEPGNLHLLRAAFGNSFGFVSCFSQQPGRVSGVLAEMKAMRPADEHPDPWQFV